MSVRIRPGDEPAWQWPMAPEGSDGDGIGADPDTESGPGSDPDRRGWFVRPHRQGRSWLSDRWRAGDWRKGTAAVLIGAVCLLVLGGLAYRLSVPAPATEESVVPAPPASAAPPDPVVTPTDPWADSVTTPPMSAVPWQGAALPISQTAGPRVFTETRATGFSHDPQGAALAAVHISTHIDPYTGPAVFTPTIEEQVVSATAGGAAGGTVTGTEAMVRRTQKLYEKAAAQRDLSAEAIADGVPILAPTGDISAWRIGTFRPDAVTTVELLVTTPQGQRLIYEVPVVWRDGDWRVMFATEAGGADFRVTEATDTDDFTTFITQDRAQGNPTQGDPSQGDPSQGGREK